LLVSRLRTGACAARTNLPAHNTLRLVAAREMNGSGQPPLTTTTSRRASGVGGAADASTVFMPRPDAAAVVVDGRQGGAAAGAAGAWGADGESGVTLTVRHGGDAGVAAGSSASATSSVALGTEAASDAAATVGASGPLGGVSDGVHSGSGGGGGKGSVQPFPGAAKRLRSLTSAGSAGGTSGGVSARGAKLLLPPGTPQTPPRLPHDPNRVLRNRHLRKFRNFALGYIAFINNRWTNLEMGRALVSAGSVSAGGAGGDGFSGWSPGDGGGGGASNRPSKPFWVSLPTSYMQQAWELLMLLPLLYTASLTPFRVFFQEADDVRAREAAGGRANDGEPAGAAVRLKCAAAPFGHSFHFVLRLPPPAHPNLPPAARVGGRGDGRVRHVCGGPIPQLHHGLHAEASAWLGAGG
jgi:hypothetical protein